MAMLVAPDVHQLPLSTKAPWVQEGMRLPASLEALPVGERPMVWSDLPVFEAKHGRNSLDMVYDLGIHARAQYQRNIQTPLVVPFDLELLMWLYDRYPSSCAWQRPTMHAVFDLVYGQVLESFPADLRPRAQIAYGVRFSRLLGRAPTVHYRWLVDDTSQGKAGTTRRIKNIVSKLQEAATKGDSAREVLESIAVAMWHRRGLDIDAVAPAYDPITLRQRLSKSALKLRAQVQTRLNRRQEVDVTYKGGAFLDAA